MPPSPARGGVAEAVQENGGTPGDELLLLPMSQSGRRFPDHAAGRTTVVTSRVATSCSRGVDHLNRAGPTGHALYLDGWSTWLDVGAAGGHAPGAVTVDVWFAPSTLATGRPGAVAGLLDHGEGDRRVLIGYDRAGRVVVRTADGDGSLDLWSEAVLRIGTWSHIAVTLDVLRCKAALYVDGAVVARGVCRSVAPDWVLGDLLVGRSATTGLIEGEIPTDCAAGLLGRLRILDGAVEAGDVPRLRREGTALPDGDLPEPDLAVPACTFESDPQRPRVHLLPPQGWMNEPHAAFDHEGRHHVFYQYNPKGPYWGAICWGHAVSTDLVRWRDVGPALLPSDTPVAPDGVWSGSAVVDAVGVPRLFFTAGDERRSPNQAVAVARPLGTDPLLRSWSADDAVLLTQPSELPGDGRRLVGGEFRDPYVWREGSEWFLLVGTGIVGEGGTALLYVSEDGEHWTLHGPLHVGNADAFPATGVMWELPVLLPVGTAPDGTERHILLVAPWWPGPSEHHLKYVWYWIGHWDALRRTWTPDTLQPSHFDYGAHLTGPSGTVTADGRSVLWTISQDGRSVAEHAVAGWSHNAGLPLELWLGDDGDVRLRPVSELTSLRGDRLVDLTRPETAVARQAVATIRGALLDIELSVRPADSPVRLHLRRSPDGAQTTTIGFDPHTRRLVVDRSQSSADTAHCAAALGGPLELENGLLNLRVVVDHSMVEAYANERRSITTRAYPFGPNTDHMQLDIGDDAVVERLEIHVLEPIHPTTCA